MGLRVVIARDPVQDLDSAQASFAVDVNMTSVFQYNNLELESLASKTKHLRDKFRRHRTLCPSGRRTIMHAAGEVEQPKHGCRMPASHAARLKR